MGVAEHNIQRHKKQCYIYRSKLKLFIECFNFLDFIEKKRGKIYKGDIENS